MTLPFLTPTHHGRETRTSGLVSPDPVTATKIQHPPDAKYTAFGEAGGHHHQVVGKTIIPKPGWTFMVNPSWPSLTWPFLLTGTPWWARIFKPSFKLLLILVQGRRST